MSPSTGLLVGEEVGGTGGKVGVPVRGAMGDTGGNVGASVGRAVVATGAIVGSSVGNDVGMGVLGLDSQTTLEAQSQTCTSWLKSNPV